MKIDYTTVEFARLKEGDTLTVMGAPHYNAQGELAVEDGAKVQVQKVYPAGVQVKTEGGDLVEFYFQHGADKLKYTPETRKAIADRAEIGRDKKPEAKSGAGGE